MMKSKGQTEEQTGKEGKNEGEKKGHREKGKSIIGNSIRNEYST